MTPATRRRIYRYGIAIDLVILASAIGLLVPVGPTFLLSLFVAAAALSAWKGGWSGAVLATGLSLAAALYFFPEAFGASRLVALVVGSVAAAALVRSVRSRGTEPQVAHPATSSGVNVPMPVALATETTASDAMARPLERAAVTQLDDFRDAARRRGGEKTDPAPAARGSEGSKRSAKEARRRAAEEARVTAERERAARAAAAAERRAEEEQRKAEEAGRLAEEQRRSADEQRRFAEVQDRQAEEQRRLQLGQAQPEPEQPTLSDDELAALRASADALVSERVAAARAQIDREAEERIVAEIAETRRRAEEQARIESAQRAESEIAAIRAAIDASVAERVAAARAEAQREAEQRLAAEMTEAQRLAEEAARAASHQNVMQRIEAARQQAEREAAEREENEVAALRTTLESDLMARLLAARAELDREVDERVMRELAAIRSEGDDRIQARLEEETAELEREIEARVTRELTARREALDREVAERVALRASEERQRADALVQERIDSELSVLAGTVEERIARELEQTRRNADEIVQARLLAEKEQIERSVEGRIAALAAEERARAEARAQERLDEELTLLSESIEQQVAREVEQARINAEEVVRARLEAERQQIEAEIQARIATELGEERARFDREVSQRAEQARAEMAGGVEAAIAREVEAVRAQLEVEQRAQFERELERVRREAEESLARSIEEERAAHQAKMDEQLAAERAQRTAAIDVELAAARVQLDQEAQARLTGEREAIQNAADASIAAARTTQQPAERVRTTEPRTGLVSKLTSWFRPRPTPTVNVSTKKVALSAAPKKPAAAAPVSRRQTKNVERKPRLLLLERRRATADTIVPRMRHKGVEIQVVERWIDAVDELFRFKPDALLLDSELPDLEKIFKTITDQNPRLPVYVTGKSAQSFNNAVPHVGFITRPYDIDHIATVARNAMEQPEALVILQNASRQAAATKVTTTPSRPAAPVAPARPTPAPKPAPARPRAAAPTDAAEDQHEPYDFLASTGDAAVVPPSIVAALAATPRLDRGSDAAYEIGCFNCRIAFDASDADWCSCLTKERTLVCTNCLTCFCKAPPAYKEKFWVEAPPRLFERKTADARRGEQPLLQNPSVAEVRRPLVLSVEDDEDIQRIVQRVCNNLGYGFLSALNGQDGLDLAREYRPNLILSDAFMPKLDGREMCRLLKEDPDFADCRMVIMTGLYTDTKYRSEALKRFHVDDYIAKPVAITDLIHLLQKHLEGVSESPQQEDLHTMHRSSSDEEPGEGASEYDGEEDVPLAELMDSPAIVEPLPKMRVTRSDRYEVCCYNCSSLFEATHAEWCSCLGRDQTLLCPECGTCFCKSPSAYKERFWMDAPPSLFERKMIGSKRNTGARSNPLPSDVKRPLILLVEDDENIQLIVRTVVSSMGFGFIVGANGQEGLALAREYSPDLILSDAFMPKLDGREMCRLLKEDPITARIKAIIMTGLYTDRKYRNEALDYFKVDDYVAKPLAVDDLIKLFKKHLPQEVQPTM